MGMRFLSDPSTSTLFRWPRESRGSSGGAAAIFTTDEIINASSHLGLRGSSLWKLLTSGQDEASKSTAGLEMVLH